MARVIIGLADSDDGDVIVTVNVTDQGTLNKGMGPSRATDVAEKACGYIQQLASLDQFDRTTPAEGEGTADFGDS